MLEIRDPAIKLFGKTISVNGDGEDSNESSNCSDNRPFKKELLVEDDSTETDTDHKSDELSPPSKELGDQSPHSESYENEKELNSENKDAESPNEEKDSNESKNSQEKQAMKKPDKILPCPRCNSMDTKFCYYNNYNVNQPRHFCKNCQRYWTAGGTMRNVPVGAGRRKNKSSSSRYCHITMSEALKAAQIDMTNGSHPGLKTNGTVLRFGSDNPLCESMSSVLSLADKNGNKNGFHSDANNVGSQEPNKQNLNGVTNQMPCFQWPYMWNPVPAFCPPGGYPMPVYPAPYWNGVVPCWVAPCVPTTQGEKSPVSNPNSPLGKHSREGEMIKPRENEKSLGTNTTVLVPKTLRIDDPDEAAKSSIWTTLGIKKGKGDPLGKGGFFNNFKSSKGEEKDRKMENSQSLEANPAALCRSIRFQESGSQ